MSALYLHNVQHRHARTRPSIGNKMLSHAARHARTRPSIGNKMFSHAARHARTRPSIGNSMLSTGNAVDPHSFFADPDPAVLLNADPDSAS